LLENDVVNRFRSLVISVVSEQELSDYHWLRVYHMLVQKRQELDTTTDKPIYRCDEVRRSDSFNRK